MALTTEDLVAHVQAELDLPSKAAAKRAVDAVLGGIAAKIQDGYTDKNFELRIHGFGAFKVKTVGEKQSRNPQTGAPIVVPARTKVVFKLTKSLADLGK